MDDELSQEHAQEIEAMVASLMEEREAVASEISVLQSIYGDNAILPFHPSPSASPPHNGFRDAGPSETVRYVVVLSLLMGASSRSRYVHSLPDHDEEVSIRILVSLPPSYPATSAPQFQLLSKYIGNFGVDAGLFGQVIRTFYSSTTGVEWSADNVCVFDGLQNVLERCAAWYEEKLNQEKVGELLREGEHASTSSGAAAAPHAHDVVGMEEQVRSVRIASDEARLPDGVQLTVAEPIVDRKSIFIGRACRITNPDEVPLIIEYLLSDRHIARAAHPVIHAWRCQVGTVLHQDNDDDGETAAGSRLAHLLQILELSNVLVVVTRIFGGIHLGPDRFKHINQAARNALELGGFLDQPDEPKKPAGKGRRK